MRVLSNFIQRCYFIFTINPELGDLKTQTCIWNCEQLSVEKNVGRLIFYI